MPSLDSIDFFQLFSGISSLFVGVNFQAISIKIFNMFLRIKRNNGVQINRRSLVVCPLFILLAPDKFPIDTDF